MNKNDIIKEIEKELSMRRKVWRKIALKDKTKVSFVDPSHNERYQRLLNAKVFIKNVNDREFAQIIERVKKKEKINNSTQTLF